MFSLRQGHIWMLVLSVESDESPFTWMAVVQSRWTSSTGQMKFPNPTRQLVAARPTKNALYHLVKQLSFTVTPAPRAARIIETSLGDRLTVTRVCVSSRASSLRTRRSCRSKAVFKPIISLIYIYTSLGICVCNLFLPGRALGLEFIW